MSGRAARRRGADRPAEPFPFQFSSRRPTGPLSAVVDSVWYARGRVPYRRERIAPTGSTVAVIVLGEPIRHSTVSGAAAGDGDGVVSTTTGFLVGPHEGPTINEPLGETHAAGIVTTPVGCEAVFGHAPAALRGRVVDLVPWWAPAAELRDRLLTVSSADAALDVLEAGVAAAAAVEVSGRDRCARAIELVEQDPLRPIHEVAAELGVSHGHLDSEFTRLVGLPPRALARLLRLRRLLAGLDVTTDPPWAELAHSWGWSDQSHFIRDFKRHTGVTPGRYVAAQRSVYSPVAPGDAAGFVPET